MGGVLHWLKVALVGLVLAGAPGLALPWTNGLNRQVIHFTAKDGPIPNPLMGWAPWATIRESRQPHTLVYADLTWRELEPQRGIYDFGTFEEKQQLSRWRAENKRVVFRFVIDRPGATDHLDIPDWLYEATGGAGDRYNSAYGKGFSPDYANPVLMEAHREAIRALGARYGADGLFAYIELGSLGHWGEWHVNTEAGIRPLPLEVVRDEYVRHYREAFPETMLLMRRPFRIARQMRLGLYNDMTGDPTSTLVWLDWIAKGGAFEQTGEEKALSAMPEGWLNAPVGGEQTVSLSHKQVYGTNLEQTLLLLERSHTTFIGPHGPYDVDPQSPLQEGIDRVLEQIGYRIYIQKVEMPFWVIQTQRLKMKVVMTFANDGIAPMYYAWPGIIAIIDSEGSVVKTYPLEMDIRDIKPGRAYQVSVAVPLSGLTGGKYRLTFAILDPTTGQPGVQLAMEPPCRDGYQELGSFEIVKFRWMDWR